MSDPNQPIQPPAYGSVPPAPPAPPAYPQSGMPAANGGQAVDPGKTMGIVGLVLSFFWVLDIAGLIISIIALNKSKKAGFKNGPALAGMIISIVTIIIGIIVIVSLIALGAAGIAAINEACAESGGTIIIDGQILECP